MLKLPKQTKENFNATINLAGVNAAVGAFSMAILNFIAGLQEPLKTFVFYFGLLVVGTVTSYLLHIILSKKRLRARSIEKCLGTAGMGIMLVLVTNETFARWIVPQFGRQSIAPFGITATSSTISVYPFFIVSLIIIIIAFIRRK